MINYTHQSLEAEKEDLNEQKQKKIRIARVILAVLIQSLLFIGIVSLPDLLKAVDKMVFLDTRRGRRRGRSSKYSQNDLQWD
jgi:hypothetical protein